ncbi:MAG: hypothetical protein JWO79_1267 [Actinomycetia bacterium]|nr:hypothetical protein [Actinomycetes bacterium]
MSPDVTPAEARASHPTQASPGTNSLCSLREMAARGLLNTIGLDGAAGDLRAAAYTIVWRLVWHRHTKRIEIGKGHYTCASSLHRMAEPCLDAFHDDVESVVDHLFTRGNTPIHNLEGWITSRIAVATIDGHRKRRGQRGALQRVRELPHRLQVALGDDPWLVDLAGAIIEWVGVPTTAGTEEWPLEAWAERRSAVTGEPAGSSPGQVARDVERVLTAMRGSCPHWYAKYIERPMGHKQLPVGSPPLTADRESPEAAHARAARVDAMVITLAAAATDAISDALAAGEDAAVAIPRILRALFLGPISAAAVADLPPGEEPLPSTRRLTALLADETSLARLVRDVLSIVEEDRRR